jgi:hypothetical protein
LNAPPGSRSTLELWLALLVRYWAFNMTVVYSRGSYWPGFGYSHDEKAEMRAISEKLSMAQYSAWLMVVVAILLPIIGVTVTAGFGCMIYAIGGVGQLSTLSGALFSLTMALIIVSCFTFGIPVAMVASAALLGRRHRVVDSDLPDRATTARYLYNLWFQLTRIAIVMMAVLVPLWILVPDNSKLWVTGRLVLPLLAPAIAVLSTAYYFSARLKRSL